MLNTFTLPAGRQVAAALLLVSCALLPRAHAAVISDDFSKSINTNDWSALGYACLTARSSTASTSPNSSIPGCVASPTDSSGSGALRLTPNTGYQRGSIVSNYTFPTNQGLQVTFTTYTFGGDKGGTGKLGADGMSFFLMDGAVGTKLGPNPGIDNLGGSGGALSYSCSNGNDVYSGLTGAYLGLGMDEYGNFLNKSDNTDTGIAAQTASTGTNGYNSWGSGTYQSNRIGLRGAGNVSWYWLNQNYPAMYPSTFSASLQKSAVQATCRTGFLWDYRSSISQTISAAAVSGTTMSLTLPSTGGYNNGDTITIGGTITATAAARTIASPSVSGKVLTLTGTGGTFSVGQTVTMGGTITVTPAGQPITSFSNYTSSGSTKTFRINITTSSGGSTTPFTTGGSVYVTGITANSGYANNAAYTIANVLPGYLLVNCGSNSCGNTYPNIGTSAAAYPGTSTTVTPVSISGNTYTTVAGTSGSTVVVNLASTASAVNSSSGTVALPAPTTTGSFTVANLSGTGFDVTLNYPAGTVTNTSGTVVGNARQTTTQVQNYGVISGGYWVLPENQPIANEAATSRSAATPITYKLMITPTGGLNFLYSYNGGAFQQVLSNWPITANNGALPSSFRFGFSGATGGSTNYHDITCFLAEPVTSASGSSGNSVQSGQFKNSTQFYTATYDSYFWNGSVTAVPIALAADGVTVQLGTATWDANCVLTGGGCATTGASNTTVQGPANRQILTWNGSQGVPLQWSSLTTAQQTVLNSTDSAGQSRLAWLRGDRTVEQTASPAGPLRARSGVLGDIVDSSPTWVGPPTINLGSVINDSLYSSSGNESSHAAFNTSLATRLNMVYVGGNDGLMHGFRTGKNTATGAYDSDLNDGREIMSYMPSSVLASSHVVDLTNPTYGHWYFADAAPGYGDLYYGGAWHTWLVSGMGPGGKEIFALDITDPDGNTATGTTALTEANASSIVKGNWTSATLTTLTCVNALTNCGDNMGNTFGTPLIRRLHNGQWAIIFGNGYGSTNQRAGVFIGLVKPTTTTSPAVAAGSVSFYWLDTGSGSSSNPNGIAYVSSADLDGDHITDYLYAGDLLGKLWRFDLTSSNPADWAASKYGQTAATPLFDAGSTHPITTQVATTVVSSSGQQRVMLGFGTGQGVPFTTSSAVTYASGTQSIYGLWDWDMSSWNGGRTTASNVIVPPSAVKYAALAQITTTPFRTFAKTDLQAFTVTTTAATSTQESTRKAGIATVCWQGSSACSTGNNKYGWVMDLPLTGEQIIYSPTFDSGALVVNTTIPPGTGVVGQCTPVATTGWTMAISMGNGGGFDQNAFADASGSFIIPSGGSSIIGLQRNLVGKVSILTVSSSRVVAGSTSGGSSSGSSTSKAGADALKLNLRGGVSVKRVTWEQIR